MELRALRENDPREGFACGDPDLDRFFLKYAGQNQFRHHIGTTYVAVQGGQVLGFATVSSAHIEVEALPSAVGKRFPRYPLPVLRLARLAVDRRAQGQGVGGALLHLVFTLALQQGSLAGCIGVVVDAKAGAEAWYARYGFMPLPLLEGESAARPRPQAMFLALATLKAALPPA